MTKILKRISSLHDYLPDSISNSVYKIKETVKKHPVATTAVLSTTAGLLMSQAFEGTINPMGLFEKTKEHLGNSINLYYIVDETGKYQGFYKDIGAGLAFFRNLFGPITALSQGYTFFADVYFRDKEEKEAKASLNP